MVGPAERDIRPSAQSIADATGGRLTADYSGREPEITITWPKSGVALTFGPKGEPKTIQPNDQPSIEVGGMEVTLHPGVIFRTPDKPLGGVGIDQEGTIFDVVPEAEIEKR